MFAHPSFGFSGDARRAEKRRHETKGRRNKRDSVTVERKMALTEERKCERKDKYDE